MNDKYDQRGYLDFRKGIKIKLIIKMVGFIFLPYCCRIYDQMHKAVFNSHRAALAAVERHGMPQKCREIKNTKKIQKKLEQNAC